MAQCTELRDGPKQFPTWQAMHQVQDVFRESHQRQQESGQETEPETSYKIYLSQDTSYPQHRDRVHPEGKAGEKFPYKLAQEGSEVARLS